MTALTAYLSNALSATLTNAKQLYIASGTPSTTNIATVVGTSTGYGEITAKGGIAGSWAASGSIGSQTGKGWIWDATTLEAQQIIAGNYSATIQLQATQSGTPAGTLTADILVRVSIYSGGVYTTIATMTLTGQTINSTATAFSLPSASGSGTNFNTGDKLYIDIWCNVTANGNGSSVQAIRIGKLSTDSTGFTGDPNASIVTPGYSPQITTVTETVVETPASDPTGTFEIVSETALNQTTETITESAAGSESISAVGNPIYKIVETASGSETIIASALTLATETVVEANLGTSEVIYEQIFIEASPTSPMAAFDLQYQYTRIMNSFAGPYIRLLTTTYYGNSNNSQVIYGELDALLRYETIANLHVMRTINDVSAFLIDVEYISNVLADTPFAYYRLAETIGSSVYDVSGRNFTGSINGIVTTGQPGPLSQAPDTSMLFDGQSGYISLPGAVRFDYWGAFSIEAWVKLSSQTFATNPTIAANSSGSDRTGFKLYLNANGNGGGFTLGNGSSSATCSFPATLTTGNWYHIVGTYDGANLKVFVNGVQSGSSTAFSGSIAPTTTLVNIGRNPAYNGDYFPGTIGHVAIYKAALPTNRITAHYNAATAP